jgi:hypothetical protein
MTEHPAVATHPRFLECDCCSSLADRLWVYRHYGFGLRLPDGAPLGVLAGGWGFCVFCHALWQKGHLTALAARVEILSPGATKELTAPVYDLLAQCVYGEPVTWEAGEPYAKIWTEEK